MDMNLPEDKTYTLEDLKQLSTNWSLKGDKILLQILENIHKDILSKTSSTCEKLNSLSSELSKASISLLNVNNKFLSLENTQFIENKVQEDDVVIIRKNEENKTETAEVSSDKKKETEKSEATAAILNAVNVSLNVLEGLCEKIQISSDTDSASDDSDTNDADLNIVLRPQDIYINKPLPYIIGSQKWQKKWHIGLQECSSDESDIEEDKHAKVEEKLEYSSSDESAETSFPKSGNEILSKKHQMSLPIPNYNSTDHQSSLTSTSTNNSTDAADSEVAKINSAQKQARVSMNHPDSSLDKTHQNEPAPQTLVKASDFAAELAKKLSANIGDAIPPTVTKAKTEDRKEKPSPPVFRNNSNNVPGLGNVFLDEPPPLETQGNKDKPQDDFIPDNENSDDYVSAGLFGDDSSSMFSKSYDNMFNSSSIFKSKPTSTYDHLFGDIPEDDNDNFNRKKSVPIKKPVKSENKTSRLFNDDNSDDNSDLFNTKLSINNSKEKQKEDNISKNVKKTMPIKKESIKNTSLFDDSENSDSDHLFMPSSKSNLNPKMSAQTTSAKIVSSKSTDKGLFDDDSDDDLFSTNVSKIHNVAKTPGVGSKPSPQPTDPKLQQTKNVPDTPAEKNIIPEASNEKKDEVNVLKKSPKNVPDVVEKNVIPDVSNQKKDEMNVPKKPFKNVSDISIEKNIPEVSNHKKDEVKILKNSSPTENMIKPTINEIIVKETNQNVIDEPPNNNNNDTQNSQSPPASNMNVSSGLFDDLPPPLDDDKDSKKLFEDDDYDDLFGANVTFGKNNDLFQTKDDIINSNRSVNIFSDEPPEYNDQFENSQNATRNTSNTPIMDNSPVQEKNDIVNKKEDLAGVAKEKSVFDKVESPEDEIDNSIFKVKNINSKQTSHNIFSDSDDDLFSTKPVKSDSNILITITSRNTGGDKKLFSDSDDDLFSNDKKIFENTKEKDDVKEKNIKTVPEPPSKIDKIEEKQNESPVKPKTQLKKQVNVGRIQSNVNINVKALMPTTIPKSVKEIRSVAEESPASLPPLITRDDDPKPPVSPQNENEPKSLDSMLCNDVLKDRAKIKVKRRPSSRKARLEAVRKSAADIYNYLDATEESNDDKCVSLPTSPEKLVQKSIETVKNESSVHTPKINPITSDKIENLFNDDSKNIIDKKESSAKILKKGLFGDSESDGELFIPKNKMNNQPKISQVVSSGVSKKKDVQKSLFDDSDDDDLFVPAGKSNPARNVFANKSQTLEKSLFGGDDDSDDELDIFKSKKEKKSKITTGHNVPKKQPPKPSTSSTAAYDDPLSNFLNE